MTKTCSHQILHDQSAKMLVRYFNLVVFFFFFRQTFSETTSIYVSVRKLKRHHLEIGCNEPIALA